MSSISQQPPAGSDVPGHAPGDTPNDSIAAPLADHAATPAAEAPAGVATAAPAGEPTEAESGGAPQATPSDASPAATAQRLKQLFPALFSGQPKPLKLRIQVDIQARAPGVFTKQALTAFFRRYTGSHGYLLAASRASHRYDLDGAPAGELSEEHRKIASDELARRRGNTEARRALEEEQRHNRATLLHDFERTTLTPANFCALKGITLEELDEYLGVARREAAERAAQGPAFDQRDRGGRQREQPPAARDRDGRDNRGRDRRGAPPGTRQEQGPGQGPRQNGGPANGPGAGPGRRRR